MPKKPTKRQVSVLVNGSPVAVTLYPPAGTRKSWYAYWNGLVFSKSTGQGQFEGAVLAVEALLRNGGKAGQLGTAVLSDDELEEIQRSHFGRKTDEQSKRRSQKSLANCLDAIAAFREITGLSPIILATPGDCAQFQRVALTLPNNWRRRPMAERQPAKHYSEQARNLRRRSGELDALDSLPYYSPNNVLRWSRSLQAAFERANRNALKRKCVRGVVEEHKLLTSNPWSQFTWIEGTRRPIRQFDSEELISLLDYLDERWNGVPIAATAAKVFLWSGCRKLEVSGLTWDALRLTGNECHFEIIGKWSVERWFRIPEGVCGELRGFRTPSPFVFAAYNEQLRRFYANHPNLITGMGAEFSPERFGSWFYHRIKEWSATTGKGVAFVHIFRKTTLQHARRGEDINRQIAEDARVSESVMMTNYVKETDEEMRQRSNRTFHRIIASLTLEVARRYGYVQDASSDLEGRLRAAVDAKDWAQAAELSRRLAENGQPEHG